MSRSPAKWVMPLRSGRDCMALDALLGTMKEFLTDPQSFDSDDLFLDATADVVTETAIFISSMFASIPEERDLIVDGSIVCNETVRYTLMFLTYFTHRYLVRNEETSIALGALIQLLSSAEPPSVYPPNS